MHVPDVLTNTRYCGDGDTEERVSRMWKEKTSGVGSKDWMYESAIQLLKLRNWVIVSHYYIPVTMW